MGGSCISCMNNIFKLEFFGVGVAAVVVVVVLLVVVVVVLVVVVVVEYW